MSDAIYIELKDKLLNIEKLTVKFPSERKPLSLRKNYFTVVDGVSFSVGSNEVLGIVGESGCGKTTIARAVLNILKFSVPFVKVEGSILLNTGNECIDINGISRRKFRKYRKYIQAVFQDPFSSLNPRFTAGEIVGEPMRYHSKVAGLEREKEVRSLLEVTGLNPADTGKYSHEFSAGQRQRLCIARALSCRPEIIVADEPVSSLDVSVQSQIINLISDIRKEFGLSMIFVSHDLSVVKYISDNILVMYMGKIVEKGSSSDVYENPLHPYTKMLFASIPVPDKKIVEQVKFKGEVPSVISRPSGCVFHTRCPIAKPECKKILPVLEEIKLGHFAACPFIKD